MAQDTEFPDGLFVDAPRAEAPDFVKGRISISRERFIEFLQTKDTEYVNIDILQARAGNWYSKVDNFKPKPKGDNRTIPTKDKKPPTDDSFDDDIPF